MEQRGDLPAAEPREREAGISVLIVDDNPLVRFGLAGVIANLEGVHVVGEAGDGASGVQQADALQPDVVLLDVQMPGTDGITAAGRLRDTAVLMLTYSDEPGTVAACIRAGAAGYLVHGRFQPQDLRAAIQEVAAGRNVLSPAATAAVFRTLREPEDGPAPAEEQPLTQRQQEIMGMLADGHTVSSIARTLFLSTKTVKNHVNHIYARLGVRTRPEAIARWTQLTAEDLRR